MKIDHVDIPAIEVPYQKGIDIPYEVKEELGRRYQERKKRRRISSSLGLLAGIASVIGAILTFSQDRKNKDID